MDAQGDFLDVKVEKTEQGFRAVLVIDGIEYRSDRYFNQEWDAAQFGREQALKMVKDAGIDHTVHEVN